MDLEMARQQHDELKSDWIKDGCKKPFYDWLLDLVERRMKGQ